MTKSERKRIMEVLRNGNFTLTYKDSGVCNLYIGKYSLSKIPKTLVPFMEFDNDDNEFDGYMPIEVSLLVEALGGKSSSV